MNRCGSALFVAIARAHLALATDSKLLLSLAESLLTQKRLWDANGLVGIVRIGNRSFHGSAQGVSPQMPDRLQVGLDLGARVGATGVSAIF
jgi:hypothetical protein